MNTELYTSAGWVPFNVETDSVRDHVCMMRGCGAQATEIVNQGRTERGEPILWAVCQGDAEEIGAENHHAEYMTERE